ncbi:MAG: trigger factor [Eubacterium sp.]|jgi:trigger factor|nr:trigger factor [Eubacterium sp.]
MSYEVENLEHSMAKIKIEVSADVFEAAVVKAYNKNKNRISLPGFRKGKAPRKLIEKQYGSNIFYEDAAEIAVPEAYREAAKECGLDIVSRPEIDIVEIESGKPFVFTATVAVKPEAKLGQYKGIEVDKQEVKILAADVNAEIDRVREQNSRIMTVDDREIEMNDIAVIDYEGFLDGVPFEGGKGEDYSLTIGSHTFIDTFEDQLIGKKPGDEVDVNVTFPEEYHSEELKGKPVTFKVVIKEVKVKELPEADDEFASEVSEFETMKEYKASVKKMLTDRRKAQVNAEKEDQALEKVMELAEVEMPGPMVEEQVSQMINEFASRLGQQGLSIDQYMQMTGMQPQMLMDQMRPEAEKRIKSRLVLEAVAKAENITATEEDIDEQLKKMAEMYHMDVEKLKESMGEEDKKQVAEDVMVEKAAEFLVKESVEVEAAAEEKEEE